MPKPWERDWGAGTKVASQASSAAPKPWERDWGAAPAGQPSPEIAADVWTPTATERLVEHTKEGFRHNLLGSSIEKYQTGRVHQNTADQARTALNYMRSRGQDRFELPTTPPAEVTEEYRQIAPLTGFQGRSADELEQLIAESSEQAEALRTENLPDIQSARRRYETMRGVGEEEGGGQVLHGAAAVLGQLAGGSASPESLVPVTRGATALRTFGRGAGVNAATTGATDPIVQSQQMSAGLREEYDPVETALSTLIGAGIGGTFNVTPELARGLRGVVGRMLRKSPDEVTADDVAAVDPEAILAEARREGLPLDETIARQTGTDRPAPADPQARGQRTRELRQTFDEPTVARRDDVDAESGQLREDAQPVTEAGSGTVLPTEELALRRQARQAAREALRREPSVADVDTAEAYLRAGESPASVKRAFDRLARQDELRDVPDMRADTARERTRQVADSAFRQAEARRRRQGETGGVDPQPGGRPSGTPPRERFTFLDAEIRDGQMVRGQQVEQTGEVRTRGDIEEAEVRYTDDAGGEVTEFVDTRRLSELGRPKDPRAAQDFTERAPRPPRGVPLERVTDRIGDDQRPGGAREPAPTPRGVGPSEPPPIETPDRRARPERAAEGDRRTQDPTLRQRIREGRATPEEIEEAVYTDPLTRLQNRRAWEDAPRKKAVASIDLDNLTVVNNTMGHEGGDDMFRQFADKLSELVGREDLFRIGGDEFTAQADNPRFLEAALKSAQDTLADATITVTHPDGRTVSRKGIGFTYVVDESYEAADAAIKAAKQARTAAGKRIDDPNKQHGDPGDVSAEAGRESGGVAEPAAQRQPDTSGPAGEVESPEPAADNVSAGDELIKDLELGRLSANPVDIVARQFARWAKGDASDWALTAERVRVLSDDLHKMVNQKKTRPGRMGLVGNFVRTLIADNDANMRMLTKGYNSETLKNLPDAFFARAGEAKGTTASLDERVSGRMNSRLIEVDKIAEYLRENKLTKRDTQQQVIRQVVSGKFTAGKTGEAAKRLSRFFGEELEYLRKAGVDVGEARNYFPRMLDTGAMVNNRARFLQVARGIYTARGMNREQATAKAEAWWQNEVYGEGGTPAFQQGAGSATPSFLKPRELSEAESLKLRDAGFYLDDINSVLGNYVMRATKRAEIAQTAVTLPSGERIAFGENFKNWDRIRKTIADEDADALEILPEIEKLAAVSAGVRNWNVGGKAQMASSWLRTWTTLATLEKATLTSMGELVLAPVRGATGSIGDLGVMLRNLNTHFGATARKMAGLPQSERIRQATALAEDVGAVAGTGHNAIMAARFAGGDPSGRVQSEVLNQFFRRIMLEQLTNYTRITALDNAGVFMRRLAIQMTESADSKKLNRPAFFLRELGVPKGREAEFSAFVRKFDKRLPLPDELRKGGDLGRYYRTALQRFADQTVMRPSANTRPTWANHPIGAVIFQLQSFGYAFQKNVINRWGRIHKKAVTGEDGLSVLDSAALVSPMLAGMAMVTGTQALVGGARDEAYRPERREETDVAKFEKAWSRAGLFGIADPWIQAATGVRYQRSVVEGLLGPALGSVGAAVDTAVAYSLNNSENTNSAERNVVRQVYDFGVEPLAQLALTLAPRSGLVGLIAKGVSVYGIPKGRDTTVDAVAGEREERDRDPRRGVSELIFGGGDSESGGRGRPVSRSAGRQVGR